MSDESINIPRLLARVPELEAIVRSTDDADRFVENYDAIASKIITKQANYVFPPEWKGKYWDKFYKARGTRFFKNRNWLLLDFPELAVEMEMVVLECGCGVGNTALPLSAANPLLKLYAFDVSRNAIDLLQESEEYSDRITSFVCDFTKEPIVCAEKVDYALLLYVLSALSLDEMKIALKHVMETLSDDGVVIVRDYAQYDLAQLRFAPENRIDDNLYVRQDGTRAYFFSIETLESLFIECGYRVMESHIVTKHIENRGEGIHMRRFFVELHAKKS